MLSNGKKKGRHNERYGWKVKEEWKRGKWMEGKEGIWWRRREMKVKREELKENWRVKGN